MDSGSAQQAAAGAAEQPEAQRPAHARRAAQGRERMDDCTATQPSHVIDESTECMVCNSNTGPGLLSTILAASMRDV